MYPKVKRQIKQDVLKKRGFLLYEEIEDCGPKKNKTYVLAEYQFDNQLRFKTFKNYLFDR